MTSEAEGGHVKSRYRADIDGLRAVAVVPVVLFHLGIAIFGGGYVGVDVFFVISGYLITGAIVRELGQNTFSLVAFYERRARRILPALIATMFAVLLAGLIIFMPDELRDTGASFVGVTTFASNILFWQQVDYFNGAVELKPLIHTWSLSVEEQFYIVVPLLLIGLNRFAPERIKSALLAITAASLTLSIALLSEAPEANYYLLPTRAWELLVGAIVALGYVPEIRQRSIAELTSSLGLGAILGSAILLRHDSPFPGYNALWPCLGAAAIIHSGAGHSTIVGNFLSSKPFVGIGLISYSLYLVHWPIIVFVGYALLRPMSAAETALMLGAIFVVATMSWRFVERPFRDRHKFTRKSIFLLSAAGLLFFAGVGAVLFATKGLPQRFPQLKTTAGVTDTATGEPKCFLKEGFAEWGGDKCFLARSLGAPVTLLWGDSHANHYRRAIAEARPPLRANILYFGSAGCLPVLRNTGEPRKHCRDNNAEVLNVIARYKVSVVVLSGYWGHTMALTGMPIDDVRFTVDVLRSKSIEVRIIGDNPDFQFANPQYLATRLKRRADPSEAFFMPTRNKPSINAELRNIAGPSRFFDPSAMLCRHDGCLAYEAGETLMTDNAHFSRYGADKVLSGMRPLLEN